MSKINFLKEKGILFKICLLTFLKACSEENLSKNIDFVRLGKVR